MKVITLDEQGFENACRQLAQRAFKWAPDCLVGIRTGGFVVAERMQASISPKTIPLFPVTKQRPSTQAKRSSSLLPKLLKRLPYTLTNALRVAEHRALTRNPTQPSRPWQPDAVEWNALTVGLVSLAPRRILVIDDAVDTGVTLGAVLEALRAVAPQAQIRSAAVVQSTAEPLVRPDDVLYVQELCRFPWSHDFKPSSHPAL